MGAETPSRSGAFGNLCGGAVLGLGCFAMRPSLRKMRIASGIRFLYQTSMTVKFPTPLFSGLRPVFVALFAACTPALVHGNSEIREWQMAEGGGSITAEIASINEETKTVVLRDVEGKESSVVFDSLSILDRAWLTEWIEMNEELAAKVDALGGRFQRFEGKGERYTTGFYVYEPSKKLAGDGSPGPLMMLFCPSGKPVRYLLRHIEGAEAANITLVTGDHFRNRLPNAEVLGRFEEVLPLIAEAVPYDSERFFLGGTSGGALAAFMLSAQFYHIQVAGIYSNGGWLGRAPGNQRPYQASRVVLVNGDNDGAANVYNKSVTQILQDRGFTVGMFAFEGGHQIPPPSVQAKSFRWLLGEFD